MASLCWLSHNYHNEPNDTVKFVLATVLATLHFKELIECSLFWFYQGLDNVMELIDTYNVLDALYCGIGLAAIGQQLVWWQID